MTTPVTKLWIQAQVLPGEKQGRTIGFPTVNLNPALIPHTTKQGVHACLVKIDDEIYHGALYLGPRIVLGEENVVLEIHIMEFDDDIYDEIIEFNLQGFIRKVMDFNELEELKQQIKQDITDIEKLLSDSL